MSNTKKPQKDILDKISVIDRKYAINPTSDLHQPKVNLQTQSYLSAIEKAEQSIRRTKGIYYKYGGKASHLLALHLKHQLALRFIPQIYDQFNQLTMCPLIINATFKSYFAKFYTSEPPKDLNTDLF